MKKYIYALIFLFVGMSVVVLFTSYKTTNKIYIDKKESYYSGFEVKQDKVYIKCYITLKNEFNIEKTVKLSANLPEDVTIGLLKNETAKALCENGAEKIFILPPNSSKSFDVIFVGEFSGKNQKHDRNLPEINVKIVK